MGSSSAGSSDSNEGFGPQPVKTKPKTTLQKVGDFVKGGGFTGMAVRAVKGSLEKGRTRREANVEMGLGSDRMSNYNTSGGDNNNNRTATNVGGKIIIAPSTAEVSQSNATDVTYDSRKTKAKGRKMTILTSSKGVGNYNQLILGKKSLLGRA